MPRLVSHPDEVKIVTRRFGQGAANIDKYIDLGWLAMSYKINGKPYTVAYFEDPSLPKPSRFSERPYGRFGAYFKATLTPGEPLMMRYRLIVTAGSPPSRDTIQSQYDQFVAELATRDSRRQ